MNKPDKDLIQATALFRYGLIADIVHQPPGTQGLYALLQQKAEKAYVIPGTTRTRVAAETMRDWIKRYRNQGGFDALMPKPRADRGQSRSLPAAVAEELISIKEENPKLSVRLVVNQALANGKIPQDLPVPPSTVHRLLSKAGLMAKKIGEPNDQDRRRFAFEQAGQLWSSDVMHGPGIMINGVRRKSYLIAFIDDATRVIPYAAFTFSENTRAFLPVYKQALLRRGLSERLYVDNGASYRSRHLSLVCAKLGVALIHARPYRPQGKGKIERFFRTVRSQLLTRLTADDTKSLEAINRRLWAWVEGEYHHAPHRGLDGETPLECWAKCGEAVNFVGADVDLDDLFLFEAVRKVQKDRTVSLNGVIYEVDAALVSEKVTLRYDPHTAKRSIQVWHEDRFIEHAKQVDLYANCFVKRNQLSSNLNVDVPASQPAPSALKLHQSKKKTPGPQDK